MRESGYGTLGDEVVFVSWSRVLEGTSDEYAGSGADVESTPFCDGPTSSSVFVLARGASRCLILGEGTTTAVWCLEIAQRMTYRTDKERSPSCSSFPRSLPTGMKKQMEDPAQTPIALRRPRPRIPGLVLVGVCEQSGDGGMIY